MRKQHNLVFGFCVHVRVHGFRNNQSAVILFLSGQGWPKRHSESSLNFERGFVLDPSLLKDLKNDDQSL